jgi:hypothetical protein
MSAIDNTHLIELFCSICDVSLSDEDVSSDVCGSCGAPMLAPTQNVTIYANPFTLTGDLG